LTVTGQHLDGTPLTVEDRQDALTALYARVFGPSKATGGPALPEKADGSPRLARADRDLIERARRDKDGERFTKLWAGQWKEAGYPSESEADLALCLRLAYWAKNDPDRVDRLFRASGLMRDKWDEQRGTQTYGELTVEKAVEKSLDGADDPDRRDRPKLVLKAVTAAQVGAMAPKEIPWVVKPWIAQGGMTELTGSVKWAGKTTLLSFMVRQMLDGQPFLGEPTVKGPAVWLTEQNETTFRYVLERAGLLHRRDLYVVFWHKTIGFPWQEVVRAAIELAGRVGAKVLIVDTLGQFSGLEDENSSAQAMAALKPLQLATTKGLAVVVVRQDRKSGGRVGESGRGSTAFAGGVDVLVSLERPEADPTSTVRKLTAIGRFPDIAPELFVTLTPSGYVSLGGEKDYAVQQAKARLRARLPRAEEEAMTIDTFLEQEPEVTRSPVTRALDELIAEGTVRQIGRGVRGDPRRFILLA
jgi:AAA domain